jgi:hypothetical protein
LTPIDFQIVEKNGTPLAKLALPALERCVEYYYFQTVWTSRYTLKQPYAVAFGTRHISALTLLLMPCRSPLFALLQCIGVLVD